ncbi:class I SAM-dependent methyltransferase, partial [bacterium]|nr:class I SAM-dependent methyltransferase [bacterium]
MKSNEKSDFESGKKILDKSLGYLREAKTVEQGMNLLMAGLLDKRTEWDAQVWEEFCKKVCLKHPVRDLVHQDPITYRSFSKPRGYAGDAVLLDFLYRDESVNRQLRQATQVGRAISEYQIATHSAASVRWRRELLARYIDETAERVDGAEIMSVACGHLREAKKSIGVEKNRIKRLVALDQDKESLQTLQEQKNGWNIECVQGTIGDLIRRRHKLGTFDFIYSAGLYDYLIDGVAKGLTKALFRMLRQDGRLLIANFVPENRESGYMEAFMDWELIYRSRHEF